MCFVHMLCYVFRDEKYLSGASQGHLSLSLPLSCHVSYCQSDQFGSAGCDDASIYQLDFINDHKYFVYGNIALIPATLLMKMLLHLLN